MLCFRPAFVRSAHTSNNVTRKAARNGLAPQKPIASISSVRQCPSPTCECAEMPPNLEIDHKTNLNGAMAVYNQHILVSTGQSDWKSRIEDEADTGPWGSVVSNLKRMLGPKGEYYSPASNTIVNTCSFSAANKTIPGQQPSRTSPFAEVLLFPSFQLVDNVGSSAEEVRDFLRSHAISRQDVKSLNTDRQIEGKAQRGSAGSNSRHNLKPISAPTILICSHNSRDSRCGVLGPLLHTEFTSYINKRHALRIKPFSEDLVNKSENAAPLTYAATKTFEPGLLASIQADAHPSSGLPINVGMISHIGGHKWAGNVIVYIPPDYHCAPVAHNEAGQSSRDRSPNVNEEGVHDGDVLDSNIETVNPLAGKGIWYGRVEPKHVEGIVEQTIGRGVVIEELFRGGIHQDGTPLRL